MPDAPTCPSCGQPMPDDIGPCPHCGWKRGDYEEEQYRGVRRLPSARQNDVNGFGLGCIGLSVVWFAFETILVLASTYGSSFLTRTGPLFAFALPLVVVGSWYFVLKKQRSGLARGVGYCLVAAIIFALGAAVVCGPHGKPQTKMPGSGDGF